MKISNFAILFYFTISSCTQNQSRLKIENLRDSNTSKPYFSTQPAKYYFDYDFSKSRIENFDDGFIDTFSINGASFKLFSSPDSTGDLVLQVLDNGSWQQNLKLNFGINGCTINVDINGDGYKDFQNFLSKGTQAFLYDATKKKFHLNEISLSFDWVLVDRNKNLYSNYWEYKGDIRTSLFKIIKLEQILVAQAQIIWDSSAKVELVKVRRCNILNNSPTDTVFINETNYPITDDFDYKKYWAELVKRKIYQ